MFDDWKRRIILEDRLVSPNAVCKYLNAPVFGLNFLVKSDDPQSFGQIAQSVTIEHMLKILKRRYEYFSSNPAYFELIDFLEKWDSNKNPYEEENRKLHQEIDNLKNTIEHLKQKDYKNRALKASLTRANKVINLLMKENKTA